MKAKVDDYVIKGLDSYTLNCTVMGTGHFMFNLESDWYKLHEIDLAAGEANMSFVPSSDMPKELCSGCEYYSIAVNPHKDFSLIYRELVGDTVRYILLYCKVNQCGNPYFHFDILEKKGGLDDVADSIYRDTTAEFLVGQGYKLVKSGDDVTSSIYSTILRAS